jgi:1-acyl-sn-glycerol-3-phosphate acyltransferase
MFYHIVKFFGFFFYKTFYWIKVFGKENRIKGKCIVACNHLGKADVWPITFLYRGKTIFMSKIEWYDNKLRAAIFKSLGSIPLDRDKPSISSIKEGISVLKNNKRLGIFPEGRRNFETNDLQEIKSGTGLFAVKGKALITPIIIYDRLKFFKKNYVIIGKPIDFSEYYDVKFTDEISQKCTEILSQRMHELQRELFE